MPERKVSKALEKLINENFKAEIAANLDCPDGGEGMSNRSKGAKGPDQWMPAINRCSYAQRWDQLIEKYRLVTTTGEIAAIGWACQ